MAASPAARGFGQTQVVAQHPGANALSGLLGSPACGRCGLAKRGDIGPLEPPGVGEDQVDVAHISVVIVHGADKVQACAEALLQLAHGPAGYAPQVKVAVLVSSVLGSGLIIKL